MEMPPTFSTGDGAPGVPQRLGSGADVGELLAALLEEQRRQTALLEQSRHLLHRILLGELDTLDAADVMAALHVGRGKLAELVETGELPMRSVGRRRLIDRATFRAVLRRWMAG